MRKNSAPKAGIFNPRILIAVVLCTLGVSFGWLSFASTPPTSNITVPSTTGQTVTVTWTGQIPALVNGTSDCANLADTPVVDQHLPTITVPAGVYNNVNAKFTFNITWDDNSGNDEILTVLKPDGSELASSDHSNPPSVETVTGNNLPAGTYKVIACGFVSGPGTQSYVGKLTIETSSGGPPHPPPTPTPTPVIPGAARFQEYIPTDANGAPSASLGLIAGEPTIGVNTHVNAGIGGDLFYQALYEILRIRFDDSTSPAKATWEFKDPPTGASNKATTDPIFLADPATGRLWALQLAGGDSLTDISTDDGESWTPALSGGIATGVDHEALGVGPYPTTGPASLIPHPTYQNAVYYCSQQVATAFCARSDDGGQTYGPIVPIYDSATSKCVGLHGHPKVAPDGTVYVPNKGCGLDTPVIGQGLVNMVVSENAGVSWTIRAVPDSTGGLSSKGDPSVGIDKDGTVYLAYQDLNTNRMRVAVTHDKGATFTPSVDVGAPAGVTYSVFPAATAGDPGRAAVAFFGSTYAGTNTNFEDMSFPGIWYLYVATTYDGGSNWHVTNTTPDNPIQGFGGIGNSGDNRNHYDFIDCQIDTQGRIIASNSIGCSAACVNNGGPNTFSKLAGIVRQSGGRRMLAAFDPQEPAKPAAPLLSGYRTNQLVYLSWPDTDNGGSPITTYNVYRRIDGGAESKIISLTQRRQLSDPADPAHSYQYRVTAVNTLGEGPSSKTFAPTVGQNAPHPELSCTLPGQVYQDRTGEGGTQPNNDIANFSIAEPQDMPGKLVFVINNAQPSLVQNGNSLFYVYFDPPSGGIRYRLRYSADPSALVNEIGTGKDNDFINDSTPETGGEFRTWTVISALEAGSGIQPDGSVRFIVDKAKLGIKNGDVLLGVAVREDTANSPSGVLAADYAGGRQDYLVVGNDFCTGSPIPISVVSRKMHGSAGTFDVDLKPPAVGIECRTGGATGDHTLVVTFGFPVAVAGNGTVKAQVTSGTGQIGSGGTANGNAVAVNGAVVTVPLTNVANAQRITISLFGVSDGIRTGDVSISMSVLLADVNASGDVNSGDVFLVQKQNGQALPPVGSADFHRDINLNGSVDSGDVFISQKQNPSQLSP
ncbi:MAG: hypothetical protein QOH39_1517 [Verrucomicrobiota bacterium]|jgi:hypothetical protein